MVKEIVCVLKNTYSVACIHKYMYVHTSHSRVRIAVPDRHIQVQSTEEFR